jgi:hypothetical protein
MKKLPSEWYYDLHWIIIRRVRRSRDWKYKAIFPNSRLLPEWYFMYFDRWYTLEDENNAFAVYWTTEHEWAYKRFLQRK